MPLVLILDLNLRRIRRKQYSREPKWVVKYMMRDGYEELRVNVEAVKRAHPEEDAINYIKRLMKDFEECRLNTDYGGRLGSLERCLNHITSLLISDGLPYHKHKYRFTANISSEGNYIIDTAGTHHDSEDHEEIVFVAYE